MLRAAKILSREAVSCKLSMLWMMINFRILVSVVDWWVCGNEMVVGVVISLCG